MAKVRIRGDWIEDFSILLRRDAIRRIRGGPDFEVFTGSKIVAAVWLGAVACVAGALGGLLVSAALWESFLYPLLWLVVVAGVSFAAYWLTRLVLERSVGFLAGWCIFWGIFIGAIAMWAAPLSSAGWAYGIAGGMGFIIGITQGNLQHADVERHEGWFMVGTILAPASACIAVWLHRHDPTGSAGLTQAATTGTIAAVLFLGPVMALYVANWNNRRSLQRLASLCLHHDDFVAEGIRLLTVGLRRTPEDAALLDRRALAHALNGDMASAEADWSRHMALEQQSRAPDIAQGWLHLRRDRLELAAAAFDKALAGKSHPWALVGRGICALRLNQPQQAIDLLGRLPATEQDARSLTYLAEAHLMLGNLQEAIRTATDAIDEADSIFGRSSLIRAEAHAKLGETDEAILAFNHALHMDDELGIEERAMKGLEKLDGPVFDDGQLEEFEKSLHRDEPSSGLAGR